MTAAAWPYAAMARNNAWANATLHGVLAGLPEGGFAAPRPGFFASLERTLNHIYEVDLYYIDALEAAGAGRAVYDRKDIADPTELGRCQAAADRRLVAFCDALTPEDLASTRATERRGGVVRETVAALLLHLFQHQIHHRGQAHVQLSDAGIAPPQLDEFFLEFERAETAEEFLDGL